MSTTTETQAGFHGGIRVLRETPIEEVEEKEAPPKYCADCYWIRNKHQESHLWGCSSPKNAITDHGTLDDRKVDDWIDLVTGKPRKLATYATAARKNDSFCGEKGNWFQTVNQVYPFLSSKSPEVRTAPSTLGKLTALSRLSSIGLDDL